MARRGLLAGLAGLALADASVVTLALPRLLEELHTTVPGVAAVIGAYTLVVALGLLPGARVAPARAARAGAAAFGLGSLVAGLAGSLGVLLAGRVVQATGAAVLLPAAFALLDGRRGGRRLWLAVSVFGTAAGPALGGALTQALDWRAIFLLQVPVALALAALPVDRPALRLQDNHNSGQSPRRGLALALLAAALTAVLFLVVLLLVAGWSLSPLDAAAAVSALPLAALLAHALVPAGGEWRAPLGCLLVGAGTLALAFLPTASVAWTVAPQVLAGAGMGLALPALAGDDDALALTVRHAGITLALLALAPLVAGDLDAAVARSRERGVALVLDAPLSPQDKLRVGPALVAGVDAERPRAGLRAAVAGQVAAAGDDAPEIAALGARADETLVAGVGEAFRTAFLVTGALALLAAVLALGAGRGGRPSRRRRPRVVLLVAAALALPVAQALLFLALSPAPPALADPCAGRDVPSSGGLSGTLQRGALQALDDAACRLGSSREELVLALADDADRRAFVRAHGVDPRSAGGILRALGLP